ncbi:hypothetical protein GOV07_03120 [Candidatus Woesearchaeota archaeon]|nr:hypothetical protein [Candidatus Woesearchaeota archaeon]
MGGQVSQDEAERSLHFSLDLPTMKLDFHGDESNLSEVRRIIESLSTELDEQEPMFDLKTRLSEEFLAHPPLNKRLKSAMLLDEDVRILKQALPFEQEYDLEEGKTTRQVNALSVKSQIAQLFDQVEGTIKDCLIHIRGELDRDQQTIIMDAIKQRLGMSVKTRFFSTRRNLEGNVLVEAICFGDGIAETW